MKAQQQPNQPDELQKAIERVTLALRYSTTAGTKDSDIVLSAAKQLHTVESQWHKAETEITNLREQLQQAEKERDEALKYQLLTTKDALALGRERDQLKASLDKWSNAELMGETERCQFDALKVQNKELKAAVEMLAKALNDSKISILDLVKYFDTYDTTRSALSENVRIIDEALALPIVQQICNPTTTQCQPQAPALNHQT